MTSLPSTWPIRRRDGRAIAKSVARIFLFVVLLACVPAVRAEKAKPFVFKPANGTGPFPVAVWLHGYRGYSAEGYVPGESAAALQKHADTLGAVIIGFPGTTELGDNSQQWSEEPVADHAYIQSKLKEIGKTVKLDLSKVALFGFSQGATVAADLATCYPESYSGAILMSPGCMSGPRASEIRVLKHEKQVYFCFCGAEEHSSNVRLTKAYATHLERVLGAKVTLKLYPGMSQHTRPPDFMAEFPKWMGAILKPDAKP